MIEPSLLSNSFEENRASDAGEIAVGRSWNRGLSFVRGPCIALEGEGNGRCLLTRSGEMEA